MKIECADPEREIVAKQKKKCKSTRIFPKSNKFRKRKREKTIKSNRTGLLTSRALTNSSTLRVLLDPQNCG